jgi:predicted DNA-binding helix-hairpin-helix protein
LNKAPRHLLLRVPGLGTKSVERVLRIRRWHKLRVDDLLRLHLPLKKLLPFVVTAGENAQARTLDRDNLAASLVVRPQQLDLFAAEPSVISGQL